MAFPGTPAELTLEIGDKKPIPLRRNFLLKLSWPGGGWGPKPVELPQSCPWNGLTVYRDPGQKPQAYNDTGSKSRTFVITVGEPDGATYQVEGRIPIPVIPFDPSTYYSNDIFLDTRIENKTNPAETFYPQGLVEWLSSLQEDEPPGSHVCWIQGAFGSGKSSFVHRLRQCLEDEPLARDRSVATGRWAIVDLAQLASTGACFARGALDMHISNELRKSSRYGQLVAPEACDEDRLQLLQTHYARAYTNGYRGIIYLADEFDQFQFPAGSRFTREQELIEHLLSTMSVIPTEGADLATVLLVADYLSLEERIGITASTLLAQISPKAGSDFREPKFHEYSLSPTYSLDDVICIFNEVIPPHSIKPEEVKRIANQILAFTHGHRTCTNRLLSEYFHYCYSLDRTSPQWTWPFVDQILCNHEAIERVQAMVDSLWRSCTKFSGSIETQRTEESERVLLKRLLSNDPPDEKDMSNDGKSRNALLAKGLLKECTDSTGAKHYKIANPLLLLGMQRSKLWE